MKRAAVAVVSVAALAMLSAGCEERPTAPVKPKNTQRWTATNAPAQDNTLPVRERGAVCATVGNRARTADGVPLLCKKNPGESLARWRNGG